jgi:hypothetical protein
MYKKRCFCIHSKKEKGGEIMNSYNYWDELEKVERKYICNESDFIYTLYE